MIMPLIFLFLLRDTGDIKRGLLSAVPNRLFEPALAVLADVDKTLGGYVRGIFLECCALGLTVMVFTHPRRRPAQVGDRDRDLYGRHQRDSVHGLRRGVAG